MKKIFLFGAIILLAVTSSYAATSGKHKHHKHHKHSMSGDKDMKK